MAEDTMRTPDGGPGSGDFARLLLGLRRQAGLSQEELAHASGVSVRALSDLERGRTCGPQRRTVQALADGLGLDPTAASALEEAARPGRPRPRTRAPRTASRSASGAAAHHPPAHDPEAHQPPAQRLLAQHTLALPRDLGDFTARGPALDALRALARDIDPAHPAVSVISGQPGLGKTSFAVHAAHRLAPYFPDGQYALDLRGMDPEPVTPRDALARLLRALGVAEQAIPAGTDDRAGLLRSVLGDKHVLLLLDNAADEEQVGPLLPGTGSSLTLITSRHSLAGLAAVHRTHLTPLRREEAVELLTRILGPERVREEAQAARDLADLCGHLPLAVRIAGQRLAARPGERLAKLTAQLAATGRRLDGLRAGGLEIRAAFALSYERLPPAARKLFRRAALASGPGFGPEAAGLLAGMPTGRAAACAEELVDAGLLQPEPAAERYRFHDLLKLFAAERLAAEDEPRVCEAARDRAAWMLRRATAAAHRFDADHPDEAPCADPDPASAPADRDAARAWLESERDEWLAALRRAAETGRHRDVIDAAQAMHWFSDLTQHWEEWAQVFRHGVDAARALGSRQDEAVQLNYLAWAHSLCLHDHQGALATADAALEAAREIGDGLQAGWALGYGAGALHRIGRREESLDRLREAASLLHSESSDQARLAELTVLNTLGHNLRHYGRPEEALAIHRRIEAVCLAGVPGRQPELAELYLASARHQIGNDLAALGRLDEAEAPLRRALAYFQSAHMPAWSEPVRLDLGILLRGLARGGEARRVLLAAHDGLAGLNSPRRSEAAAELGALGGVAEADPMPTEPTV
ncbi:helix-turn-helix domain-containing protein [Streptomyces sp. A1547]|uniref:ATP-binding protein n=1 Tax=Streptomyces sp. A1547 TaxID=2563105 RepID=UPI001F0FCB99|nr:helix-turn-helix domain-containing protein [Streptomyces sp. A1547]